MAKINLTQAVKELSTQVQEAEEAYNAATAALDSGGAAILRPIVEKLGTNADAVARRLRKLGIKGEAGDPKSCPVANYLKTQFADTKILVDDSCVTVNGVTINSPDAISAFVDAFDRNEYEYLVLAPKKKAKKKK
jgi:hypothetical protein